MDAEATSVWWDEPEQWPAVDDPALQEPTNRVSLQQPVSRRRDPPRGSSRRPTRPRSHRTLPTITAPQFLTNASIIQDRLLIGLVALSALSLTFMLAIVGSRIDQLPETISLHLNAAGAPDVTGYRTSLWRLPLAAAMLTVMNAVAAWFFVSRDAFIARLVVESSFLVHVLAWIAILQITQ